VDPAEFLSSSVAVPFKEIGWGVSIGEDRLNQLPEDFEAEGLAQDRAGCQFSWPVRMLLRRSAAHQDDASEQTWPAANNRQEKRISGHLREANIEQYKIETRFVQHLICRLWVSDGHDLVV
jgi:hypothetical protein